MGYGGQLGVFKFSEAKFYTQWRFLVHTLMHCISKKTTGWSEFSSTIAYALVCLATARKYNFSKMIFNDLVSNLGNKKSFYMYPRFVQAVITNELTDMPQFDEVYVPKIPKGKVFSNMKRSPLDSEGVDTPLFSTMMVVSHNPEGMASGSRPSFDHPLKANPNLQSPYQSHSLLFKNQLLQSPIPTSGKRKTTGVSPNPKEVLTKEMNEHMGAKAATTPASIEEASGNINKTFPMATLGEQSSKGGNTPGEGEDRYDYNELMETMGNINLDVIKQGKDIEEMKMVILSQHVQITKLKKMVTRLVQKKRRRQFLLKKRKNANDAFNKGENSEAEAEKERLSVEELEIAETLVKAKNDTPKATQKAKGVVINEGGLEKKRKERSEAGLKDAKGKAKMVESEQPSKKKNQVELDEEVAKQLQAEMEKEEQLQSEKDRELALDMDRKLNEEYQKSIKTAAEVKKIPVKRMPVKKQKRQPSKTFLANQERRKMINFLKGSIGVKGEMFTNMAYSQVEELYKKEMAKLQGDFSQREDAERRMKERHDLNIQHPFPEEVTPTKEKAEDTKEENDGMEMKDAKRVKTIASKKQSKKPRIEEAEIETEPSVTPSAESVVPISVKAPEVIFWDILRDNRNDYFRLKRVGDVFEVYSTWGKVLRSCSRADLEEMHKVGIKLYEHVDYRIKDLHHEYGFKKIDKWILFENCGVYMITIDNCYHEYYLVDKVYDHSKEKLNGMLKAKLVCAKESEMARIVVRKTINQSLGLDLDPNLGN
ncbi:hypothetical protein L6452_38907 [Arctium lappa]|uniref:Uncharacterized protein n=1 Tax=Arctium lappa TaxID=4217 RepID=A0ACB8XRA8_ARCLA|nr:hypothetical protein L6452_38907 [Arctium lappa]